MYSVRDVSQEFPFNGQYVVFGPTDHPEDYQLHPDFPQDSPLAWVSYGVVDSIDQFNDKLGPMLTSDPRTFVVCFTHVPKEPELAGERMGWRWHKWGPYFGEGQPCCEYLDDEPEFDQGVWTFQILQTGGPDLNA